MKKPIYKNTGFWVAVVAVLLIAALGITFAVQLSDSRVKQELTVEQCQAIVDEAFQKLPESNTGVAKYILNNTTITVTDCQVGFEKDMVLACTYTTLDAKGTLSPELDQLMVQAYEYTQKKSGNASGADIDLRCIRKPMLALIKQAPVITGQIQLHIYETSNGMTLYLSDDVVDTCTGGIISLIQTIEGMNQVEYEGASIDISKTGTLRTGVAGPLKLTNYSSDKPFTGGKLVEAWLDFKADFHTNFIEGDRYMHLVRGLGVTLSLTLFAALGGIALGFIIAIIRCTNQMTGSLKFLDGICRTYLTVMRGTPVMVQLLILHFVVFSPMGIKPFLSAVICFGMNSGAYVAEIVRGGIMSVDKGQIEAGRSLGFNYVQTMVLFVMPQAFKAILPSLANEFITLLKESSVAFAIGLGDLTFGGNLIRSNTYSPFLPLLAVAAIYLILVMVLTKLVGILERRLAKSDH